MGNEQLRQALRSAGLEVDDLAVKAEVDVKTARRWLSGRTPRPRYRRRVSDTLGVAEQILWPDAVPDHEQAEGSAEDVVEVLTASNATDWRELLADTRERIDLLDLTLSEIIAEGDEQLLAAAAARGCRVRVLVSDPDSVHLAIAEQDAGREVSLAARPAATGELDRVVELLSSQVQRGNLHLRKFVGAGSYRVLIFDDQALVRLRVPGAQPEAMPLLSITRERSDGIFDSFAQHFDAIWQNGEPLR